MRLTFPHMGTMWLPVQALLEGLGHEVVVPPPITERTVALGQRGAPETVCLPLKLNLGNYIEAFELGADTVLMGGGVGPCRFGYYAEIERHVLEDMGHHFDMMVLEPPKGQLALAWKRFKPLLTKVGWPEVVQAVRTAWEKARLVDEVEQLALVLRARETVRGSATRAREQALVAVKEAAGIQGVRNARAKVRAIMSGVPQDPQRKPLRVAMVGEIYTVLEPFASRNVERLLGDMGVEVVRTIYLSDWLRDQFFSLLRFDTQKRARLLGRPYLPYFVGGHGLESVAHAVYHANNGCDGAVHILPFTCMPEIVAQTILPTVSRDTRMPIMTLVVDEHSAEAGIVTRLEAFVDMLKRRRKRALEG